jgi:hypothetical protein
MSEIHTKAIRIHLLWGYWRPEKTDKAITATTNQSLGVASGRGHYDKQIFSPEFMKGLREHTSKTKAYYYSHTLPWEDKVARLISTRTVEEVSIQLNRAVTQYEEILRQTVGDENAYESAIYDQRIYMGSAWNYGDYPRREAFMNKYHASLSILPLVTTTDLRCELSDALKQQIIISVERDMEERFRLAMADCWKRLYEPVKKMAETLADPKQAFRDTLVTNVREVVDVMPELNILNDPKLNEMVARVRDTLAFVEPDDLREDLFDRAEYAKKADELADILNSMGVQ